MSPEPPCTSTAAWRCFDLPLSHLPVKRILGLRCACAAKVLEFKAPEHIYMVLAQLLCLKPFAKPETCVIGGAVIPAGAVALIGVSL